MAKKWLNIIVSIWLVNALAGFQGTYLFTGGAEDQYAFTTYNATHVTLFDIFARPVQHGHHMANNHKIDHRDRFVNSHGPGAGVSMFVQQIFVYLFALLITLPAVQLFAFYLHRKTRPRYYAYLFRLTPF